ncbi:MAG: hypothetical protein N2483_09765 [Burkholderiaceae bacterium]|nr:hypothetical protein [Burkholderiaceae bacterium]
MDILTPISIVFAVASGLFAFWKHYEDKLHMREWESAKLAKELIEKLDSNQKALDATYMLGLWEGRLYQSTPDLPPFRINCVNELINVLTPERKPLTRNETYVRDCFDNLFFHIEQIYVCVDLNLIKNNQVEPLLKTLVEGCDGKLAEVAINFCRFMGYSRSAGKLPSLFLKTSVSSGEARPPVQPFCAGAQC